MTDKLRVAILDDYQNVAFTSADWSPILGRLAIDTFPETLHDEDKLAERLHDYEVICAMRERTKFTASLLDRLPNLKLIATTGPFNLGIDVTHAKSKGILVSGTGGAGNPTLDHIWALILATVRHIVEEDTNVKAAKPQWQSVVPGGLAGKTLGLVGVGRFGSLVAQVAKLFNLRVIAWSPNLTLERASKAGVEFAPSKEYLFKESDIVSIHMVLSDSTKGLVSASDLRLLKPTAYFINTSRGPLVDEAALIEILQQGRIRGAGLDVFDVEPLPLAHPLRKLGNIVTLSPHNAYVSDDNYKVFWGQTVENIGAYIDGKPTRLIG
ncbi:D-isomer specific 2-hydroxyacid dehydrogenase [Macrolepiota fuliginosa MF-IS2]|uniref:D-isomer specific 2-hydroxyacid dehydrogenase n=1 Tax=Macrolepiota fuliginosa MF-IS2 TaxID=1400762 RepID=A0A9P6C0P1_9AGAR|nr:D-isomer specific 2-hydroxyacid dehydrogenase [Macrolepiota fuliginosa MF-IS2]